MIAEVLLATGVALILYAFYKWGTQNNDFFTKRGFKQIDPTFLLGNSAPFITRTCTAPEFSMSIYNAFPEERVFGVFDFVSPVYLLRDLELIKQITIKDFDHFEDRRSFTGRESDDLFSNSLILLKGEKWRDMRSTLSPAFTGSKMRQMFELVSECGDELIKHLQERANKGEVIDFEMKDLFSCFTNDVIASCAFGLKINSMQDPKNEFLLAGKKFMKFTDPLMMIKFLFIRALPRVANALGIDFIDSSVSKFFRSMVLDTMTVREEKKIFRPDMINILMQVRKGTDIVQNTTKEEQSTSSNEGFATVQESAIGENVVHREWTDNQIVAQCFIFFLAGFDTSSNLLTTLAYELVANPDIQQKLHDEIKATHESRQGKRIDYETLQKMKYMDQVVTETLRKWPPAPQIDRICVKDYKYEDASVKLNIKKGTTVFIPVYGIHHDPQYYPDPERFDPERFSDENKDNIVPGSFIPFGVGPRNCIGSRFALMEVKGILYYLLLNFSLKPNEKTEIPIVLKKTPFSLVPKNGLHLRLTPRTL